jgi:hypothetical protein
MDQNERIRLLEAAVAELSSSLRIAAEDAERVAREAVDEHADAGSERTTRRGVGGVHDDGDSGTHFIIDITGYYL